MQELDDNALLREYVAHHSEEAFAAIVTRHIDKVYSIALRHTRNPHQAEEISQAVFVILAKKSSHLGKDVILAGWLCQTARLTARTFIRGELRRAHREQEAYMQNVLKESGSEVWLQIAPLLDAAMSHLNAKDHHALVLRFFDDKSMKEIGAALGGSEDSAKMRVNRAVDKLRGFFKKRGVIIPAAVLVTALSANAVQGAPSLLAQTATAAAFAKGATASASTLTLIKGALKVMAWTKVKTAVVIGVVAVLATGTTTTLIIEHHRQAPNHRSDTSNLPLMTQNESLDLQADGTIRFQTDVDDINPGKNPLKTFQFMNSDFVHVEHITDKSGDPIKFTTQHSGNLFHYTVTLNQPVPPGAKIAATMDGTMTGLIKPTAEPGVFEYFMDHTPGYAGNTRRIEVHDLPPGATLLESTPNDLLVTTNGDQIELRIDKIIPPGGSLAVKYRYRLAAN